MTSGVGPQTQILVDTTFEVRSSSLLYGIPADFAQWGCLPDGACQCHFGLWHELRREALF